MSKPIYKFYDLEHLTQEDLNKLALERNTLHQENQQLKEVIEEVRERSKIERKTALSLNQHYAVSIIDSVLQILDKAKGE